MQSWAKLAVAVAVPGAAIFLVVLAALCHHCRRRQKLLGSDTDVVLPRSKSMPTKESLCFYGSDAAGLRFHHLDRQDRGRSRHRQRHHCRLHRPGSDFSWDEHPALVVEAVEGGWSRFAFMGRSDSLPRSGTLLGLCVACDLGRAPRPAAEVGWEVPVGSSEFMQTVRLDPSGDGGGGGPLDGEGPHSAARMSLPLPGPSLGGDPPSFPQEAYFEITILHLQRPQQRRLPPRGSKRVKDSSGGGDRRKLIPDNPSAALFSDDSEQEQERKLPAEEQSGSSKGLADAIIWLGLTRGGIPQEKPPGSHPGSIGFNSNGSVYLDGIKLVLESEKSRWGGVNRVVGCGFDPGRKTVFFTMDSALLHVIHCRSDAFGSPLYPALAANADAMVSVNLGQCAFRYPPANAQRTPNPCFLRPSPSAHIHYDDSRELFSMGRIDSQWQLVSKMIQPNGGSAIGAHVDGREGQEEQDDKRDGGGGSAVVDIDAESDLFEISLNS